LVARVSNEFPQAQLTMVGCSFGCMLLFTGISLDRGANALEMN